MNTYTYVFEEIDYNFIELCKIGNIGNIINYYDENIKKGLDISVNYYSGFRWCCKFGYVDVIKWFLNVSPNIDIQEIWAFHDALEFGKVDVAKLLLEFCPNLKIEAPEFIFWKCCSNGYLNVLKFIIDNKIYIPNIDDSDDMVGFTNAIDKLHYNIFEYLTNIILPNEEIKIYLEKELQKLKKKIKIKKTKLNVKRFKIIKLIKNYITPFNI